MRTKVSYFLEREDWDLDRATPGSSGYDIRVALGCPRTMQAGERWFFSTGLYLAIPWGVEAQVRSRSGLALNHGVIVLNAPGTVDSDYRGEVKVTLINTSRQDYVVNPDDKIAQLVFAPVLMLESRPDAWRFRHKSDDRMVLERVNARGELDDTARGVRGHGSSGR